MRKGCLKRNVRQIHSSFTKLTCSDNTASMVSAGIVDKIMCVKFMQNRVASERDHFDFLMISRRFSSSV